jgi:hypothetical protein
LDHHTEQQLKSLYNKVKNHRMRMRLLAITHFKAGKNKAEGWLMNGLRTTWKVELAPLKVKNHREEPLSYRPSKSQADRLH